MPVQLKPVRDFPFAALQRIAQVRHRHGGDHRRLPKVVVVHLGDGDVEVPPKLVQQGLHDLTFVLQGKGVWDVKMILDEQNVHDGLAAGDRTYILGATNIPEVPTALTEILSKVRNVPDFPKPGIQFKDITTLLADGEAFRDVLDGLERRYEFAGLTHVVGVESRGFIFGAALADRLGVGFVPVRKKGKLPADTIEASYALEYGEATVEIHRDALDSSSRVVIVDDLLATGGTLKAACDLVTQLGAQVEEIWVLIELGFLPGRAKLEGFKVHAEAVVASE